MKHPPLSTSLFQMQSTGYRWVTFFTNPSTNRLSLRRSKIPSYTECVIGSRLKPMNEPATHFSVGNQSSFEKRFTARFTLWLERLS